MPHERVPSIQEINLNKEAVVIAAAIKPKYVRKCLAAIIIASRSKEIHCDYPVSFRSLTEIPIFFHGIFLTDGKARPRNTKANQTNNRSHAAGGVDKRGMEEQNDAQDNYVFVGAQAKVICSIRVSAGLVETVETYHRIQTAQ